jgi:hypothetical protein
MWLRFCCTVTPTTSWSFIKYPFLWSFSFIFISILWCPTSTKTYRMILLLSAVTPIHIHADSDSTSFQMSAVPPSPTAANIFSVKEPERTFFSVRYVIIFTLFYRVLNWWSWIYMRFQQSLYFFKICYYLCPIILSNTELVEMNLHQIFRNH